MVWIILIVVVLILLFIAATYNSLVTLKTRTENQWAQVNVVLKKRFDLIPNLVETVKGYAKHEKGTLEDVIAARNKFTTATTPEAEMEASGELSKTLSKLMMLTESYPELKADKNFLALQEDLKDVENKIAIARQFYNDRVLAYVTKIRRFPTNIIASIFKFKEMQYFEITESDKEVPKVSF